MNKNTFNQKVFVDFLLTVLLKLKKQKSGLKDLQLLEYDAGV